MINSFLMEVQCKGCKILQQRYLKIRPFIFCVLHVLLQRLVWKIRADKDAPCKQARGVIIDPCHRARRLNSHRV